MRRKLLHNNDLIEADIDFSSATLKINIDGNEAEFPVVFNKQQMYLIQKGETLQKCYVFRDKDTVYVHTNGRHWTFQDVTRQDSDAIAGGGGTEDNIMSPMPGSVIKVMVEEGESVKTGQTLVIVEAMKMENEVRSPRDAVISSVNVEAGQQVGGGEVLVEFEAVDDQTKADPE